MVCLWRVFMRPAMNSKSRRLSDDDFAVNESVRVAFKWEENSKMCAPAVVFTESEAIYLRREKREERKRNEHAPDSKSDVL